MLGLYCFHNFVGDVQVLNGIVLCFEDGYIHSLKGGNKLGKMRLINGFK